jgi:mannose-1-phosphate guanylyltransferase
MKNIVLLFIPCIYCNTGMAQKLHIDYSLMNKTEKFVTNLEMRTLEWSRLHQLDSLKTIVPADYLGIFSSTGTKRNSQKDALTYSNNFVLRSYEVDNLVTYNITPNVVVVSYEMAQDGENADGESGQLK